MSAEKYEEFLKALDVSYILRKAATVSNPSLEISEDGAGVWSIKTSTTLKSMELKFKVLQIKEQTTHAFSSHIINTLCRLAWRRI